MKKLWGVLFLFLLLTATCYAESGTEAPCDHLWVPYKAEVHGLLPEEVVLEVCTDVYHLYVTYKPSRVCVLCGERERGTGAGSYIQHSYTVTKWEKDEATGIVYFQMVCGVCQYVYEGRVTRQMVVDGLGEHCLLGGPCVEKRVGELFENGMIMFDTQGTDLPVGFETGEKIVNHVVIYDPQEETYLYTQCTYCPLCGRPKIYPTQSFSPKKEFDERWEGLPIITMEEFLNNAVLENLPYQYLDRLRQEGE